MTRELKIDWMTLGLYLLIVILGWFNIYSTGRAENPAIFDLDAHHGREILWISASLFIGIIILLLDTKFLEVISYIIYGIMIVLLIAVMFVGKTKGATSWFPIGPFKFQPTEFAKVATILAMARYMSRFNFSFDNLSDILVTGAIILAPAVLILLQNDAGSALVFVSLVMVLYREGINPLLIGAIVYIAVVGIIAILFGDTWTMRILLSVGAVAGVVISFFYLAGRRFFVIHVAVALKLIAIIMVIGFVIKPHHSARIRVLVESEEQIKAQDLNDVYYNLRESQVAIGSGGIWGKGYGNATHTSGDFVPEEHTDYIFCVVAEEHGFVKGSLPLLALIFLLLARIIYVAENSRSKYARIYGYGVASIIFFHSMINIGMTIGLIPTVGIPLVFFSYGGSSMIAFSMMIFILANHYAYRTNILS